MQLYSFCFYLFLLYLFFFYTVYFLSILLVFIFILLIVVLVCDMKMILIFMNLYLNQHTHALKIYWYLTHKEYVIFIYER